MKIIALFDTHIGFEETRRGKKIPVHINLNPVFRFIYDFKPDLVILGGDMHDFTAVCHWIANQALPLEGLRVKACFKELHQVLLNPLQDVLPKGARMVYLEGNHEHWLKQAISINPNGQGYWELENNIDLKRFRMKIMPMNIPYRINDHLCYIHGANINEYHARKTVQDYHTSIFYGHTHDMQMYTSVSPVDVKHFYKGMSCGCLCHKNPSYKRNKPNRWVNGFHYCYVNDNTGYFSDVPVTIVENTFWANGRFYK